MTMQRYWVVGGEYSCLGFKALKGGAPQALGPYDTRAEAEAAWRRISDETRSLAATRYAIAAEQLILPN